MSAQENKPKPAAELSKELMIVQYLMDNPDFFMRYAPQIEKLQVPHPVRGSVSLVEWHLARQRNHIQQLEQEITLLMEQASENQQLFKQLLVLQAEMVNADSLAEMLSRLQRWAKQLGLAGAEVRLFTDYWQLDPPCDFQELNLSRQRFDSVRIQRFAQHRHYLGGLHSAELRLLLPEAKAVGSVAMSILQEQGQAVGVLIFSSCNQHHYQQGLGTTLLESIADLLPPLLANWIAKR